VEGLRDRFRPSNAVENVLWIGSVLDNAALNYETPLYAGDIALFQPADRPDVLDYRQGWREVVLGGFATFEILAAIAPCWKSPMSPSWVRA
jgi:hypothetical protein